MTYITYTTRQTVAAQGMDSGGLSPQNDAQPPPTKSGRPSQFRLQHLRKAV